MSDIPATSNGRSLGRAEITTSHAEVAVKWYRTDGTPPIFAGFQSNWVEGEDPATGTSFDLSAGAGMGSKYMTLRVEIPGRATVYEYVDIAEVLQARVSDIITETAANHVA